MSQQVVLTGMVIYSAPSGEYDKRVVILTKERGKITAFARGARRPGSSLLAATNTFAFGEFELFEGRNAYSLTKAVIQNHFLNLVNSFEAPFYGYYFMEIADYYTRENNDEKMMLKLLYQSFRALEKENIDNRLIKIIFELKALTINGEYPQMFQCVGCEENKTDYWFSMKACGVLCEECKKRADDAFKITESTVYTMQYIITSSIEKLFTFKVSDQVLMELNYIMKKYMRAYIDKEFKSLPILENIIG